MAQLRVVISGSGFMGREILAACLREPDLEPVGVLEKFASENVYALADGRNLPMSASPEVIATLKPDVVVDFSNAAWTPLVAEAALTSGTHLVIGTTGLDEEFITGLARRCEERELGAVVAANYAIGAVLMIHLASLAAPYFEFAEITEMHQEKKLDSPSGTALSTARVMREARGRPFEHAAPEKETLAGARGALYEGIAIHSQRMPGFVAHQEVALGGLGQTLRIRHDSTGRESFIPGILLAIRQVVQRPGLTRGLDKLIGL